MKLTVASQFLTLSSIVGCLFAGASDDLEAHLGMSRRLQVCGAGGFQAADIVILFDESGSMGNEQAAAASGTVALFEAFQAASGSAPRFAVGGFGKSGSSESQRIREVTPDFVSTKGDLEAALNSLVTTGGTEEGYEALYDVFTTTGSKNAVDNIDWSFNSGASICVLIFTDEDSDGSRSAGEVNAAKGSNAIIPIVSGGGHSYSEVSSLPGKSTLSLYAFTNNPNQFFADIVNECSIALAPTAICKDVSIDLPMDGVVCKATVDPAEFDDGSTDPNGDQLFFTASPSSPYYVGTTIVEVTVDDGNGNCDTCTATVTVTGPPCPRNGEVIDDPHFKTWAGQWYDYMGKCQK